MSRKLVELGPDQTSALPRLANELGETQTAIIRAGLALLQIAVREARHGRGIGIVNGGQVISELTGLWSIATNDQLNPICRTAAGAST